MKKILNQIIVPLKNRYKEKNIDLKLKGVNSVKIIYADRLKIKQIFINLLDNAYKFTMEGLIQFQVKEKAKNYLFIIKDTGLGIDEKDYPKIFTDFERSSIAEINSIDGTGLGLTLTKRLIELHKGKIWFESEVSKGSIFYFTIPKPISPVEEFLKLI
ncbi:MAG: HAMP domain-containing sensor histidine kinase [Candidatus Lokiarchaeota archaeon]